MVETDFAKRLEMVRGTESVHAFSKKTGISDTMMRKYLDGSMPGLSNLLQISERAGVTLDWLAAGRGPMQISQDLKGEVDTGADMMMTDANGNVVALIQMKRSNPEPYTFITRFDVHASAGSGAISYGETPLDFLAFQNDWLRARNIRPEYAKLLTAKGDSMMETIHDGDALLVDTSINEFKDNAIYVLIYGNMVLVKRVHARMNGTVQLISDNPRYAPEEISAGDVDQISIAGRVMWYGRTM